jgi:Spy/CpxP family protein refolding chaperone
MIMSMRSRFALTLSVPLVLVACQGSGDTSAPTEPTGASDQAISASSPAASDARAEARERRDPRDRDRGPRGRHGHRMGPPGPEHLLEVALRELDLSAAQRSAIEAARPTDTARPEPRRQPPEAMTTALAAAVRAGTIDAAALASTIGAEPAGLVERKAAVASALTTLHAALSKEQRRALVDTVAKEMEEHAPKGPPPFARRAGERGGPMGHLLEDLDLTDAQRASIDAALAADRPSPPDEAELRARFESMRSELRARLDGFVSDAFDARAFVEPPSDGPGRPGPRGHLDRMAKDLAAVVAVLTPAQREALAAKLEKGPPRGHMGPPPDRDEPAPDGAAR